MYNVIILVLMAYDITVGAIEWESELFAKKMYFDKVCSNVLDKAWSAGMKSDRWVVYKYEKGGGIGDILPSFIVGLSLAIKTNRSFRVDWEPLEDIYGKSEWRWSWRHHSQSNNTIFSQQEEVQEKQKISRAKLIKSTNNNACRGIFDNTIGNELKLSIRNLLSQCLDIKLIKSELINAPERVISLVTNRGISSKELFSSVIRLANFPQTHEGTIWFYFCFTQILSVPTNFFNNNIDQYQVPILWNGRATQMKFSHLLATFKKYSSSRSNNMRSIAFHHRVTDNMMRQEVRRQKEQAAATNFLQKPYSATDFSQKASQRIQQLVALYPPSYKILCFLATNSVNERRQFAAWSKNSGCTDSIVQNYSGYSHAGYSRGSSPGSKQTDQISNHYILYSTLIDWFLLRTTNFVILTSAHSCVQSGFTTSAILSTDPLFDQQAIPLDLTIFNNEHDDQPYMYKSVYPPIWKLTSLVSSPTRCSHGAEFRWPSYLTSS
uniref:Uncharacterized protein n=1 Tax=Aureoumbra lagunensis TaxID=44058 RepID=A0A7S3K5X3_9STRA|mmetsp:Transcript_11285/g.15488  ORF Transcript_11285/g.15488 Transcript_11285/m.15488 type:complete len:492 (+) Transcript_11285:49-1524(+)